ncbi:CTP synthase (glutamine hydrolyzing) [Candidatus Woesearchaeota archaeon]|nr:CTP synthase (glutamine hydrolyzing) [Candidatus Woesearchaeota archaeon]
MPQENKTSKKYSSQDLLDSISNLSDEHEFYTPIPPKYKVGTTKYLIVFGTVMSGLGKGIFSSSLARLLQIKGLKVAPIKLEGYLNVDSGTLNPFRHGEVYVLDDGMETDMDLGTYERILNLNLTKDNFATNGQILGKILERERKGKYLGRDVQFLPHVTGEIKNLLRNLAVSNNADVVVVEIGGTAGDIENMVYIEAMRELAYEEGKENVCFAALTYIIEPVFLGEQKSKAAQLGLRALLSMGIQPDIIGCRAHKKISEKIKEKISIYSNVPVSRVVSLHDVPTVYQIPLMLRETNIDKEVMRILQIDVDIDPKKELEELEKIQRYVDGIQNPKKEIAIGITGKYTNMRDAYASIVKALEHAGASLNTKINIEWIEATDIETGKLGVEKALKDINGIIVPGGFGKRGVEGKIKCIEYARKNNIPFLGICYGLQMALIEFARNVLKLEDVHTTELKPDAKNPVICLLPEQYKIEGLGGNMRLGGRDIEVKPHTMASRLYNNQTTIRERFRHRFECNPDYIEMFEKQGIVFSGKAPHTNIMQIFELPSHKFFIGTQYHPEFTSRQFSPQPLFYGLIKACVE